MSGEREARYFAERLRVIMAKRDWSGADLARGLGMSRASVAPWMRGTSRPPARKIMAISKLLSVDASWLVAPYPVDLCAPATDDMRATLIGMHVAGLFSEGQTAKATGLDRIEIRKRADLHLAKLNGASHD